MARLTPMVGVALPLFAPANAFAPTGHLRSSQALTPNTPDVSFDAAPRSAHQTSTASLAASGALVACGLAAVGVGSAQVSRPLRASRVERHVVGICEPLSDKFDPLSLGDSEAKMDRYTAVEIKHGRVAMLATVGYVIPEVFRFPGCESFESGLGALSTLPVEGWVQLVALLGAHEILVKPRADGMGSSDFGLGTWLLDGSDAQEVERVQTSERNNGRLAMVAILGLMWQDGTFGKSPIAYMNTEGWWGSSVQYLVQDIPVISGGGIAAMPRMRQAPTLTALRATIYESPLPPVTKKPIVMSESMPFLSKCESLEGWVGDKGFDPLRCSDALPMWLLREAELKHGRVCMLATVGWIATDLGARFQGDVFQQVTSTVAAHDAMVTAGIMQPFLGSIAVLELFSGWLYLKYWGGDLQREAGDFQLGKQFLPKDEDKAKEMQLKELENGRLAMFAFSGIATQAVLTGKAWPFL